MEDGCSGNRDPHGVSPRFFIDECLSAALVAVAKDRGYPAVFGPHLGMAGWQDWNIVKFAVENGHVVVTNNRRDFLKEYLKYDTHPGLVVLVPQAERSVQTRLFSAVLDVFDTADGDLDRDACGGAGRRRARVSTLEQA